MPQNHCSGKIPLPVFERFQAYSNSFWIACDDLSIHRRWDGDLVYAMVGYPRQRSLWSLNISGSHGRAFVVQIHQSLAHKRNNPGRFRTGSATFGAEVREVFMPLLNQASALKHVGESQCRQRSFSYM
jgi:hypothetical protein